MKRKTLSAQQIEALLEHFDLKDRTFDAPAPQKPEPKDLRVSTDQRQWDYLMKISKQEFKEIIWRRELDKAEQVILVLRGDHDLIMTYCLVEHVFTSDKALLELAKRQNLEELDAVLRRSALPAEAQVYIFEKGFAETRDYLAKKGCIGASGELAMVRRGSHHDIMVYLRHHQMYPATVKEVIKRGNHDEIMACLKHKNAMFGENLKLLIERGDAEEVATCIARCYPQVKIPE